MSRAILCDMVASAEGNVILHESGPIASTTDVVFETGSAIVVSVELGLIVHVVTESYQVLFMHRLLTELVVHETAVVAHAKPVAGLLQIVEDLLKDDTLCSSVKLMPDCGDRVSKVEEIHHPQKHRTLCCPALVMSSETP